MTDAEPWTIGRLLTWTADYLKQHGMENPRLDAEVLLAVARGCTRIDLYTAYDELATPETRSTFRQWVHRRAEGTPVAYLVGRREFFSLDFRVTPAVLIPRPETELLVVALLDRVRESRSDAPISIADVGTGSGIIAICVVKYCDTCRVTAIDISRPALDVAAANAAEHDVADRIELVESDFFTALAPHRCFDFIASNPPYVSAGDMTTLAMDVRKHEPRAALVAGQRGTECIERLVGEARSRLRSGGWLLVEIGPDQDQAVGQMMDGSGCFERGPTIKDLAGLPRVVQARRR